MDKKTSFAFPDKRKGKMLIFILFAAIIFLSFFYFKPEKADAAFSDRTNGNSGYARIITEDTPFYSDPSGTRLLFYLPYTYYVRVLADGAFFTHVECYGTGTTAAIDGYVPSEMLFYDGLSVKEPYANVKLTALSTAVLYTDADLSSPAQYVFSGRTMNYYGFLPVSENSYLYFVGYNDRLGYVKESDVMPFDLPYHPNELTFIQKEEPEPKPAQEQPEENKSSSKSILDLRILIIACLAFAGITALFIAFRKKPDKRAAAGYYDENDYE